MRILLTCLLALFTLGGTYVYIRFANRVIERSQPYRAEISERIYSLELLRTFVAVPQLASHLSQSSGQRLQSANSALVSDDFSSFQSTEVKRDAASILVLFKGEPILIRLDEVPAREALVIQEIPAVESGQNEIFVRARLQPPAEGELAAIQLRVRSQGRMIAESTFTGYRGSPIIYGTVTFEAHAGAEE
jgi:hypothetical protein